ncbi:MULTISPECIES: hypothetical protein [Clostridium]|jgi:pyruvate/2-oxoglutarate dehydrogenase complex dihydrolipoamide dehydrogenase (E3) component|uniref:hypothetical protein n=1 Tax=Clostridium TaxID=1485 RepID=UPI000E8741EE|nr:hypothetical protein [Clostridium tyrobutyricum]HBF78258.1 hypothetical protein [Clostridiaceae bacterium]
MDYVDIIDNIMGKITKAIYKGICKGYNISKKLIINQIERYKQYKAEKKASNAHFIRNPNVKVLNQNQYSRIKKRHNIINIGSHLYPAIYKNKRHKGHY